MRGFFYFFVQRALRAPCLQKIFENQAKFIHTEPCRPFVPCEKPNKTFFPCHHPHSHSNLAAKNPLSTLCPTFRHFVVTKCRHIIPRSNRLGALYNPPSNCKAPKPLPNALGRKNRFRAPGAKGGPALRNRNFGKIFFPHCSSRTCATLTQRHLPPITPPSA